MRLSLLGLPAILVITSLLIACRGPQDAEDQSATTQQDADAVRPAPTVADGPVIEAATPAAAEEGGEEMALTLTSTGFEPGGPIPPRYSCDGEDVSPPLAWSDPPPGTQSFALIFDDPDAPGGTWVHWVLFNIPASARSVPEAIAPDAALADGSVHGTTSFGSLGYGGPCPPGGTHRYFFKLYALDAVLDLEVGANKVDLEAAMESHILAPAELKGTYGR